MTEADMALEIPSLPSSDLNNMLSLFLKPPMRSTPRGIWPDAAGTAVTVVEDYADTDRSPEPRTPKFGVSSTPTFDESNSQFGFRFPGPVARAPESAMVAGVSGVSNAAPLTNVSVFVSEAESSIPANPQPEHVVMEVEPTVTESAAQYILVQESAVSSSDFTSATHTPSQEAVAPQMMNIPTTVLDKVGESSKRQKKVDPSEMPQIMLSAGDGKPVSFIRFLNDPIPLPVQYEHHELNIDKYRTPVEDSHQTGQSDSVDQRVIADTDAIQRMEQEPVYHPDTHNGRQTNQSVPVDHRIIADIDAIQRMEQEALYHPDTYNESLSSSSSDQSVPPGDQSSGSEQSTYYESVSDDSSSNSLSPYHNNPDVMINEVAAYQSVDETPTYTELTTRAPPPPTPCPPHQQESQPFTYRHSTKDTTRDRIPQDSGKHSRDTESPYPPLTQTDLKNELKNKIRLKRLKEGKSELKVSFENRPIGEPSAEEKQKAETRRQKNRDSAVRSREKRQKQMTELEKEVRELERENKKLQREINSLKEENSALLKFDLQCGCSNGESQPETLTPNANTQHEESDDDLKKAISALLASETNT